MSDSTRSDLLRLPDPATGGSFALAKFYADCVTPSGDVAIVYSGRISWNQIRVALSGVSMFDRGGTAAASWWLSSGEFSLDGCDLRWRHGDARLQARSRGARFRDSLFESATGAVAFDCIVPDGEVSVTQGARTIEGRGYAERLEMTVAPWSLPIDTLRWGRFTCAEERVVWIEWKGRAPLRRVYRNGEACEEATIGEDEIELPDGHTLHLGARRELRSGALGGFRGAVSTLVAQLPGMADVHETKWLRAGRVERRGVTIADGWAIDEEVRLR